MTNVEAFKKLAAAVKNDGTTPDKIKGNTIAQVVSYIADIWNGGSGGELIDLTVTSAAGTTNNATVATVSPALTSGNTYAYKITPSDAEAPAYLEVIEGATPWDGTSEIVGEDGHRLNIYELNADGECVGYGVATMHVLIE